MSTWHALVGDHLQRFSGAGHSLAFRLAISSYEQHFSEKLRFTIATKVQGQLKCFIAATGCSTCNTHVLLLLNICWISRNSNEQTVMCLRPHPPLFLLPTCTCSIVTFFALLVWGGGGVWGRERVH